MKANIILVAIIALVLTEGFLWPETKNDSIYPILKVKIYEPSKLGGKTCCW